ncbi:LsmAD domain-containing protein [Aphelenchoides bicaudatus]|nr:LsmAD domain-containing protein [Aphelenchoides bicaudatus]
MSAALDQPRDLPAKRVNSEEPAREPSLDKSINNSRSSTENGVNSTGSRDGTPDQRRRSPSSATQEAASALVQMSNTPPLSKQNSQSPKKPSTPVQKRESLDEVTDKVGALSIASPKNQQKSADPILSNREDALTCNVNKKREGNFRTDREYLNGEEQETDDLEVWQSDPEHTVAINDRLDERGRRGWAPDDMFKTNNRLGVQSTYNGIEEYSNVAPDGDEEARREADRIASEIEQNKDSRRYAMLENDDDERDLDKETRFNNDRDNGRGPKRQSGGYQSKGNRSQFNNGTGGNRNYSNSPRNSYPNTGSGNSSTNSGSNRYSSGSQPRQQQRSSYASNFSAANATSRQNAPATSWRNESPQQQTNQSSGYSKPAVKSPTLHLEERRQSASPVPPKYAGAEQSNSSIRRTNSVQNRQQQQPSYSPRPEAYSQQQVDRRVPDNRYHEGSSSTSSIQPPVSPHTQYQQQPEVQPLMTPIPKQPPTPQASYDNQYMQSAEEERPKKKLFTFNPDAPAFVPKAQKTPSATPSAMQPVNMPVQSGMANSGPYNSQAIPMSFINVPMQQGPMLLAQQQVFSQQAQQMAGMQSMPQQMTAQSRVYQPVDTLSYVDNGKMMERPQQKYVTQIGLQHGMAAHPVQYVPQQQYAQQAAQVVPPQMQINSLHHPQFTGYGQQQGMVSGSLSYQHNAPIVQQQQIMYPYQYSNGQ